MQSTLSGSPQSQLAVEVERSIVVITSLFPRSSSVFEYNVIFRYSNSGRVLLESVCHIILREGMSGAS